MGSSYQEQTWLQAALTSESAAFGFLLLYCLIYVLPLHLFPAARAARHRSRDDPEAIRARIRAVTFSTAACSLATLVLLLRASGNTAASSNRGSRDAWHLLGYWPLGLLDAASSVGLTALLFAAPLYERLFIDGWWKDWSRLEPMQQLWSQWPAWRNYVAGPITEECLFRSSAVPLLIVAGSNLKTIVFLSPLVFGLAHVHHFYEFRVTHPQIPLIQAVAQSVLQFSYTYLFGIYATFLYLRNGSLLAVILVHTFCNSMGLPRVWGSVEPYWLWRRDVTEIAGAVRLWTIIYYVLLFGGSWAWYKSLYSWTQSSMALAEF